MGGGENPPPRGSAALFVDLATRDGRRAVELRRASRVADGALLAPARSTVASVAYDGRSVVARGAAVARALGHARAAGLVVAAVVVAPDRRALWQ